MARFDFWIAVAAILGVLSGRRPRGRRDRRRPLARLAHLCRHEATDARCWAGRPGSQVFRDLDENPGDETFPGIAVLRLDSGLFFATAEALEDRVRAVIRDSEPRLHALVLDLEGVDFVDSQGAAKLAELYEVTKTDGVKLRLARVKPQVLAVLDADGMVATLGADNIHGNIDQAIEAQLAEDGRFAAMMIFDWDLGCAISVFVLSESVCGRVRQSPHAAAGRARCDAMASAALPGVACQHRGMWRHSAKLTGA